MMAATSILAAIILCLIFSALAHAEQSQVISAFIAADPLYVRLIGNFDPNVDDVYFISALQIFFDEYYQTHYADTLNGFDIAAFFIYRATLYELENFESTAKVTSWCEIQTAFSAPIDLDSSRFNTNRATQFVTDFFSNAQSTELIDRLRQRNNISIATIEAFSKSSDVVQSDLQAYVSIPSDSSSSNPTVLKVLVSISVTIICLAVVALMVSTLYRRYEATKNNDRLGIQKREAITKSISFPISHANSITMQDQTCSDIENEFDIQCSDDDEIHQENSGILKKVDPPIVSSESFKIESDDDETVVTRNQVSPTTSQHNSPTTTNSSANGSPIWSMFSGHSADHTTSPYSTEEVLYKRYRRHDSDPDDEDADIHQMLSLPEEPQSPGTSSYESSRCGTIDESDSTGSPSSRDS